jgi:hypothetical protein
MPDDTLLGGKPKPPRRSASSGVPRKVRCSSRWKLSPGGDRPSRVAVPGRATEVRKWSRSGRLGMASGRLQAEAAGCVTTGGGPEIHDAKAAPPRLGEGRHGSGELDDGFGPLRRGGGEMACPQGTDGNTRSLTVGAGHRLDHRMPRVSGHRRVAEGLVVPIKPGDSSGGKPKSFP